MSRATVPSDNLVTVVIPTVGRASLGDAVASACRQVGVPTRVLVMADLPEIEDASLGIDTSLSAVEIHFFGGGHGAGAMRHAGTMAAQTPWVAFLDDDDVWLPHKLERQLAVVESQQDPKKTVVCCRFAYIDENGHECVVPATTYETGPIEDYFFRKRKISSRRNTIPTSTILLSTELAQLSNWNPDLRRHQDWDFLARLARIDGVVIHQLNDVCVEIGASELGGISRSVDWRSSLEWGKEFRGVWADETYIDFVVGQPLRYAIASRDLNGVRTVAKEFKGLPLPSINCALLGLSGLMSGNLFSRAMARSAASSSRKHAGGSVSQADHR